MFTNKQVVLNAYGFYELAEKPNANELAEYYSQKYYQSNKGSYEKSYTEKELAYFANKNEQKHWVINHISVDSTNKNLLDIGCGEGFTLAYFKNQSWEVTGIDYSDFGCKQFNPDCVDNLLIGDIYENISKLIQANNKYSVIWLDNVLEHVLDPLELLKNCKSLLHADGVIVIEVPNDFSPLQNHLLEIKHIDEEFWVVVPDHISYFNKSGLSSIAQAADLQEQYTISDFPIDFNLVNPDSNYIKDKSKGKNAHFARVEIDNLMHSISVEKTVAYFKSLADLGMGRQIISFFKHSV